MNYNGILADRASPGASGSTEQQGPGTAQRLSRLDWLSSSILHDLRNPVATIYASTEMLLNSLLGPTETKRLAANMHTAAARMRKLLTELNCATHGHKTTAEICDISEVITAASEAVSASMQRPSIRISLDVPRGIEAPLARARIECVFFNLIINFHIQDT